MNKRNYIIGGIVIAGLLGLTTLGAMAGGMRGGGFGRHDGGMQHMMRGLDLTDEQQDQVFNIMHQQKPVIHEKMKVLRKGHEGLFELAQSNDYTEQKARKLAETQTKVMTDMLVLRMDSFNKIYGLLTPEQQKKLAERKDRRRGFSD